MVAQEKAGKRKLFHSLVKLANELRKTRESSMGLVEHQTYADKFWYEGGLFRMPTLLPGVHTRVQKTVRPRDPLSLSSLFFQLVIVTAMTRVGVAVSARGYLDLSAFFYFAVVWTVWSKEKDYSTRFDTTDVGAHFVRILTCFSVLFATLSVQGNYMSVDGSRIMMMAAFVSGLHFLLHVQVALVCRTEHSAEDNPLSRHVTNYAVFNIIMNALETAVWIVGIFFGPQWEWRWAAFSAGLILALRVPRAFLANDFHAACSVRGVLFILLLGFNLQSVVVVASEFFEYQTPMLEHYAFVGAACLLLFCIKLLFVDDSDTLAEDHALLVNRWAASFFNIGHFALLLSTTIMGSGLNLLTHDYLAVSAALPGPSKTLITGGFAATLLSILFIKSMHLKRIPVDTKGQVLFIMAFGFQSIVALAVIIVSTMMCLGKGIELLDTLMQNDIQLLFALSCSALVVVLVSWIDEGVELLLYSSEEDPRSFRIHPFGFWWCLKPDISSEEIDAMGDSNQSETTRSLSALSPLLGSSAANLKSEYGSSMKREEV